MFRPYEVVCPDGVRLVREWVTRIEYGQQLCQIGVDTILSPCQSLWRLGGLERRGGLFPAVVPGLD